MSTQRTLAPLSCALAAVALALVSCSGEAPTDPDPASITAEAGAAEASFMAQGATHTVTGKGTIWSPSSNEFVNIAFTARLMPDGSASGYWHHQSRSRFPESRVFVQVTCLTVVGNQAWMGGIAVQAGAERNLGRPFGLRVVDNGEGGAAVDQMTRTVWPASVGDSPEDFCTDMPTNQPLWPLAGGNVQVR